MALMKKSNILFIGIFAILIVVNLAACWSKTPEAAFTTMISTKNVNQVIELRPLPTSKQVFDGKRIILLLANLSDQMVKFPADYGIRLFVFGEKENQWSEIPNLLKYEIVVPEGQTLVENDYVDSQGRIKLHPFGSPFEKPESSPISAKPDLDGVQRPFTLRIVVLGMIGDNQSEEKKVAAYYDIHIDQ